MLRKRTRASVAARIRHILKTDGSGEYAHGVEWFFKEDIQSHGWPTADLRRRCRQRRGPEFSPVHSRNLAQLFRMACA